MAYDSFDFLPFGEQIAGGSGTTHKFTGDERDSESNLDTTWFRQYSSTLGRWMHPDPAGLAAVDISNPQSWNRYAYVSNNPMNAVDPSGMSDCPDVKATCGDNPDDPWSGSPGVGLWGTWSGSDFDPLAMHWDPRKQDWVGDSDGEVYCSEAGICVRWNERTQTWTSFGSGFPGAPYIYGGRGGGSVDRPIQVLHSIVTANNTINRSAQCYNDTHTSTAGKAIGFFSLLSYTPLNKNSGNAWVETGKYGTLKIAGLAALKRAGQFMMDSESTTAQILGTSVYGIANGVEEGATVAGPILTLAATTVDAPMVAVCSTKSYIEELIEQRSF